jgi:hypothetical protein
MMCRGFDSLSFLLWGNTGLRSEENPNPLSMAERSLSDYFIWALRLLRIALLESSWLLLAYPQMQMRLLLVGSGRLWLRRHWAHLLLLRHGCWRIRMTNCLAQMLLLRHEGPLRSMDIIDYESGILTLRAIWNAL